MALAGEAETRAAPGRSGAVPMDGPQRETVRRLVRAEQVRTLAQQGSPILLANVVNAAILSAVLWSHTSHGLLVGWTGLVALMALVRVRMRDAYLSRPHSTAEQDVWGQRFTVGSLCAGLLWGFAGFAFLPGPLPYQVVIVFVIGGMAAGAAGSISCFMPAYYAYLVASLLPPVARLLAFGDDAHLAMSGMLALYAAALSLIARNVNKALMQAFQLRFENAELVSQLSAAQASLVEANEGLARANEHLEMRVRERTAELRARERELAEIVRESPDALVIFDEHGTILSINPAAERISGRRADTLVGMHFAAIGALFDADHSRAFESFHAALKGGDQPEEFQLRRPDGQTVSVEINPRVVQGADGKLRVHTSIRDVTERHRVQRLKDDYERRLRQAQRLESVGLLAGGVAHDFNNVLTMILGNVDTMASGQHDDETRELLGEIRHGSLQAASLTKQLLAFSRQQVLNVKPTDVLQLLTYARPMLERALGEQNTLSVSVSGEPVTVLADASQLEQAIINLLINAKHAMPGGGSVRIGVERMEFATHPDWPDAASGNHVCISVTDTGVGMDDETRQRVFDPFFTTREFGHGTGLGLSTVYGIVEQAGGRIRVLSEPGKGTTFEMLLPFHRSSRSDPPRDSLPGEWVAGSGVALVVEDQPQVQRATRRILSAAGYHVLSAVDGEEALRVASGQSTPIDVLVTDVIMPGLSGVELSRRLLKQNPALAVVLVSGYAGKEIAELAELGPDVQFLQKPFDAAKLTSTVAATIKLKGKTTRGV